jgi:hypothetical protein
VWGTVLGGAAYFLFAAVPLFLAYSANLIDPALTAKWLAEDSQKLLPELVKGHLPLLAQVIFYGALLSVIMSTASGTLLAPSVTISENVIKDFITRRKHLPEKQLLSLTRWVVAGVFPMRHPLCPVGPGSGNRHPPDGGERLQGDPGAGLRTPGGGPVLEARQHGAPTWPSAWAWPPGCPWNSSCPRARIPFRPSSPASSWPAAG